MSSRSSRRPPTSAPVKPHPEETTSAVHYVRFHFTPNRSPPSGANRSAWCEPSRISRWAPRVPLTSTRAELAADLPGGEAADDGGPSTRWSTTEELWCPSSIEARFLSEIAGAHEPELLAPLVINGAGELGQECRRCVARMERTARGVRRDLGGQCMGCSARVVG